MTPPLAGTTFNGDGRYGRPAAAPASPQPTAGRQLEELRARLSNALQRYPNPPGSYGQRPPGAPVAGVPPAAALGNEPASSPEVAELRLAVREQALRAESLTIELYQTQAALTEAVTETERAYQLLREADARAERQRADMAALRGTIDDLQHQITELTSSRASLEIELSKARQQPPPPAAAAPAATEAAPPAKESKPPEPPTKSVAMWRGRPVQS